MQWNTPHAADFMPVLGIAWLFMLFTDEISN